MKKYKVEIIQTEKYVIDVLADNEDEAKKLAEKKWDIVCDNGTYHLYESDSDTIIDTVYDVTNTDDPFNP